LSRGSTIGRVSAKRASRDRSIPTAIEQSSAKSFTTPTTLSAQHRTGTAVSGQRDVIADRAINQIQRATGADVKSTAFRILPVTTIVCRASRGAFRTPAAAASSGAIAADERIRCRQSMEARKMDPTACRASANGSPRRSAVSSLASERFVPFNLRISDFNIPGERNSTTGCPAA
jgi:hypothetical protein